MNTKKLLLPVLLVCTALLTASCSLIGGSGLGGGIPGSGVIQTETREPGAFEAIAIEYPGAEIIIQQGDKETVEIGLGDFNAADLQSNKAAIEISGMGGATVRVEEELAATITGAGSINYFGNPHVEQSVNGAGSVKPAE